MRKTAVSISIVVVLLVGVYGCTAQQVIGALEGLSGGIGGRDQLGFLTTTIGSVFNATQDITDDQEYYLGRSVSAQILAEPAYSKIYELRSATENRPVTQYINHIGYALVLVSGRPETYGNYHFVVVDSQEFNAFAAPGGNIFITTGLLNVTTSEDEIAAIIAHEITHVAKKHGIAVIKSSRWKGATATILLKGAQEYGPDELRHLLSSFAGAVQDIKETLIYNTYSPERENEADSEGVLILARAGYNPWAMVSILERLNKVTSEEQKGGWLKEHETFETRIENVKKTIEREKLQKRPSSTRKDRHTTVLALLEKKKG